jgi:hypothetical protein
MEEHKDVKKYRVLLCAVGLLFALVPAVTLADGRSDVAAAKRQANIANDAARCSLAAQGVQLPGTIGASTPEAAVACSNLGPNVEVRALQALPAGMQPTCSIVSGLTEKQTLLQKAPLYDYLIAKAKAEKKGKSVPMPSPVVLNLMAC